MGIMKEEKLHWCFRCLSQKYTLSSCFMVPGRRTFPMQSVGICFLGLFSSAGCSTGPDHSWLIQQIPELEGDAGCVLPRGGWLAGEGTTCRALMEVRQQKEEAAGSERESACLHTASMAPPSVAPSETALSQKVDLDSATWMLLVYFSMCRTWNTQHLVCSRDTKYLNLITSSIHSKYVNIYFWQIFVYRKILKKGEFVGVFISNTWTSLKQSLILYLTTSIL